MRDMVALLGVADHRAATFVGGWRESDGVLVQPAMSQAKTFGNRIVLTVGQKGEKRRRSPFLRQSASASSPFATELECVRRICGGSMHRESRRAYAT